MPVRLVCPTRDLAIVEESYLCFIPKGRRDTGEETLVPDGKGRAAQKELLLVLPENKPGT